jgi:AcrR family transcriptional regulator
MPRGDRSTATRDALLQAAARVFVTRGPYGARVRDIAREAGLTVPALYYHFEGTGELYDQVVQDGRARFTALIEAALDIDGSPRERLLAIARSYVEFGREDPVRLRLLCLELFRPREPGEPDNGAADLNAWLQASVEGVLAAGIRGGALPAVDAAAARRLFIAVLTGLLVEQARAPETPILEEELAERAVGLFVEGLRGLPR